MLASAWAMGTVLQTHIPNKRLKILTDMRLSCRRITVLVWKIKRTVQRGPHLPQMCLYWKAICQEAGISRRNTASRQNLSLSTSAFNAEDWVDASNPNRHSGVAWRERLVLSPTWACCTSQSKAGQGASSLARWRSGGPESHFSAWVWGTNSEWQPMRHAWWSMKKVQARDKCGMRSRQNLKFYYFLLVSMCGEAIHCKRFQVTFL